MITSKEYKRAKLAWNRQGQNKTTEPHPGIDGFWVLLSYGVVQDMGVDERFAHPKKSHRRHNTLKWAGL